MKCMPNLSPGIGRKLDQNDQREWKNDDNIKV